MGVASVAAYAAARKPTFALSATTSPLSVAPGQQKQYTVRVKRIRGFKGALTFKVNKLPRGAKVRWTLPNGRKLPRARRGGGYVLVRRYKQAVLTVVTRSATPHGTYRPSVIATSGRIRRTTKLKLLVQPPPTHGLALVASPLERELLTGDRTAFDVTVVRLGGFDGPVEMGVAGAPAGVVATVEWPDGPAGSRATVVLEAAGDAPAGTHELTLGAAGGDGLRALTRVTLVVREGRPFAIAGSVDAPLAPGRRRPLDLTLTNPNDFDLVVARLDARVVATDPGCDATANFRVLPLAGGVLPLTLRPGTSSLTALGVAPERLPQVEMLNLAAPQDACQGARVELAYDGAAGR